jgi:predicted ATP-grasp superfamily ATP-dependent carboligase
MTHRPRKLAIVGASTRAAAFSALRAGFEVVAADLFADADLQRVCPASRITGYPEALADWLAATPCDAWMYTGALENHPELVDSMAAIKPLLGNHGDALRNSRDPLKLQQNLRDVGVGFPETTASLDGLPLDGSWLCKTYRGASGSGVWQLKDGVALMRAVQSHQYFQRWVDGTAASATFVVYGCGALMLGATRQLLGLGTNGAERWRYRGSIGTLPISVAVRRQLAALGELLSEELSLRGLVGVDLVLDGNRMWVIEINPRYSASVEIIERASGASAVAAHVNACMESSLASPTIVDHVGDDLLHGKAVLYARRGAVISDSFFRWAMERNSFEPVGCDLADISPVGTQISVGSPVLTVFGSGRNCEQILEERLAEAERRLYAAP